MSPLKFAITVCPDPTFVELVMVTAPVRPLLFVVPVGTPVTAVPVYVMVLAIPAPPASVSVKMLSFTLNVLPHLIVPTFNVDFESAVACLLIVMADTEFDWR